MLRYAPNSRASDAPTDFSTQIEIATHRMVNVILRPGVKTEGKIKGWIHGWLYGFRML